MSTGRDDDQTWAELVDAFHADPDPDDHMHRWPAAEDLDTDDVPGYDDLDPYHTAAHALGEPASGALTETDPARDEQPGSADAVSADDDHFVPPTPPPIPRGDAVSRWAWAGLLAAPIVLFIATILDWSPPQEIMVLLIGGFIAGFITLVARMRGRNPHDPDNGAVV